jgi:hypothetical protein
MAQKMKRHAGEANELGHIMSEKRADVREFSQMPWHERRGEIPDDEGGQGQS